MRFLKVRNIGIKLPEQVPEKIRQSFNLLIPAMVVILTIYPLNLFMQHQFGMLLPDLIMAIFKPLISAADSLPAISVCRIPVRFMVCRYPWRGDCRWYSGNRSIWLTWS